MAYLAPSEFVTKMVDAGESKIFMSTRDTVIRAYMAGAILALAAAFAIPNLDREVKWHCKYARQNGIHVSPTFMVDGLVRADMSSGDSIADWISRLPA